MDAMRHEYITISLTVKRAVFEQRVALAFIKYFVFGRFGKP